MKKTAGARRQPRLAALSLYPAVPRGRGPRGTASFFALLRGRGGGLPSVPTAVAPKVTAVAWGGVRARLFASQARLGGIAALTVCLLLLLLLTPLAAPQAVHAAPGENIVVSGNGGGGGGGGGGYGTGGIGLPGGAGGNGGAAGNGNAANAGGNGGTGAPGVADSFVYAMGGGGGGTMASNGYNGDDGAFPGQPGTGGTAGGAPGSAVIGAFGGSGANGAPTDTAHSDTAFASLSLLGGQGGSGGGSGFGSQGGSGGTGGNASLTLTAPQVTTGSLTITGGNGGNMGGGGSAGGPGGPGGNASLAATGGLTLTGSGTLTGGTDGTGTPAAPGGLATLTVAGNLTAPSGGALTFTGNSAASIGRLVVPSGSFSLLASGTGNGTVVIHDVTVAPGADLLFGGSNIGQLYFTRGTAPLLNNQSSGSTTLTLPQGYTPAQAALNLPIYTGPTQPIYTRGNTNDSFTPVLAADGTLSGTLQIQGGLAAGTYTRTVTATGIGIGAGTATHTVTVNVVEPGLFLNITGPATAQVSWDNGAGFLPYTPGMAIPAGATGFLLRLTPGGSVPTLFTFSGGAPGTIYATAPAANQAEDYSTTYTVQGGAPLPARVQLAITAAPATRTAQANQDLPAQWPGTGNLLVNRITTPYAEAPGAMPTSVYLNGRLLTGTQLAIGNNSEGVLEASITPEALAGLAPGTHTVVVVLSTETPMGGVYHAVFGNFTVPGAASSSAPPASSAASSGAGTNTAATTNTPAAPSPQTGDSAPLLPLALLALASAAGLGWLLKCVVHIPQAK